MNFLELLFSPYGAVKRMQFLIGMITVTVVTIGLLLIISFVTSKYLANLGLDVHHKRENVQAMLKYETTYYPMLMIMVSVYAAWMKLCLTLKRLRDLALTPWLVLVILGVEGLLYLPVVQNTLWMQIVLAIFIFSCLLGLLFYPSRISRSA